MAMTCLTALIAATSIGTALFSGMVPVGPMTSDILSLVLAGLTAVAVASAAALDS
jgi:hypothetical protein